MIHVVNVLAGTSKDAQIAQKHAIRMAKLFGARLRVLTVWGPDSGDLPSQLGKSWEEIAQEEARRVASEVGDAEIVVEASMRGEGLIEGLLAEARESDLLVLALPDCPTGHEPACKLIRHEDLPVLRKAECMVMVVHQEPSPIKSLLVDYHGGIEGKAALRITGEIAAREMSKVTVMCVNGTRENAELLTGSARRYLEAFGIRDIATFERLGQTGSASEVLDIAESAAADLVIVGGEEHGMLEWLRGRAVPEAIELSEDGHRPVLVAR